MKVAIGIRLHGELLKAIDEARGDVPRTRWIERALEQRLRVEQDTARERERAPSKP